MKRLHKPGHEVFPQGLVNFQVQTHISRHTLSVTLPKAKQMEAQSELWIR